MDPLTLKAVHAAVWSRLESINRIIAGPRVTVKGKFEPGREPKTNLERNLVDERLRLLRWLDANPWRP